VELDAHQLQRLQHALLREEEREAVTDQHGNFPVEASVLTRLGLLEDPPLHADIQRLAESSSAAWPRWPDGYRFAACLTHDVDRIVQYPWRERWRQLRMLHRTAPLSALLRWGSAAACYAMVTAVGCSDQAPYDAWMADEATFGYRSTFFVLPETLAAPNPLDHYYRYTDPVRFQRHAMSFAQATRLAARAGWEIGLHGSYASAFDATILRAEKALVEAMLEQPITAVRQHFLRFAVAVTPRIQADAGFRVDSTLGYSGTIGCRAGLAFPYFWLGIDLLEVPLIIQDVGLLRTQGRHPNLSQAILRAKTLIEKVANVGGVATLGWHTHPESPGARECYRELLTYIARLGGWGCTLGEMDTWWRQRRSNYRAIARDVASPTIPTHDHVV